MRLLSQLVYSLLMLQLSWIVMTASHELGHVIGAWLTGGEVVAVTLLPLRISGTIVDPNPSPGLVVWLGPVCGVLLPTLPLLFVRQATGLLPNSVRFVAGFCQVANGAYIGVGGFLAIGDRRVMSDTGTPLWVMAGFGAVAAASGLRLWHRLGRLSGFVTAHTAIPDTAALRLAMITATAVAAELLAARLLS